MEVGVFAPSPNFQEGLAVWVYRGETVVSQGGREASTFLKSGWGLRLMAFSNSPVSSAWEVAIFLVWGGLVLVENWLEGEGCLGGVRLGYK